MSKTIATTKWLAKRSCSTVELQPQRTANGAGGIRTRNLAIIIDVVPPAFVAIFTCKQRVTSVGQTFTELPCFAETRQGLGLNQRPSLSGRSHHVVRPAFTSLLYFSITATRIGERRCFRSRGVEPRCSFRGFANVLSACIRRFVEAVVRSAKFAVTRQLTVVVTAAFDRTSAKAGCRLSATTA